jgi:Domain of unknown function (DUF4217)
MRSIYLQKDKKIFNLEGIDAQQFAQSLGLPGAPKIKFLKDLAKAKEKKNAPRSFARPDLEEESVSEKEEAGDDDEDGSGSERQDEDVVLTAAAKVNWMCPHSRGVAEFADTLSFYFSEWRPDKV